MEVEAKEAECAEEGEGGVYFDIWSFSGDDEDEIPVRNPLTPPQLLQEMEVEAKEAECAEEGEGGVYFDIWSFSGDDEDEIPVRNPLTPPLPPMVFGNAKDGYLPTRVFNAVKECRSV